MTRARFAFWSIALSIPFWIFAPLSMGAGPARTIQLGLVGTIAGIAALLVGCLLVLNAIVLIASGRSGLAAGRAHLCRACGYDLRGIDSDVCPECGAEREAR